jgi:putative N6-adenine-specific DNA methylase
MDWPGFDPASWQSLLTESANQRRSHIPMIYASDRDAGAVQMAQANAQRAGVANQIEFSCRAVSAVEPEGVGWVVTNPPYGLRVSANKDLRNLYAQFGKVLRSKCPGWQVTILCSDQQLLHQTGLRLETRLSFINGGVKVKVGRGEVGD